jgi:hypothetical protein
MVDGVIWIPGHAPGFEVPDHLAAGAGDLVQIFPPANLVSTTEQEVAGP